MKLLTRSEAAEFLRVTVRTIDRYRKQGLLPWIDVKRGIGKRPLVRFFLEDLQEVMHRRKQNVEY